MLRLKAFIRNMAREVNLGFLTSDKNMIKYTKKKKKAVTSNRDKSTRK